MTYKVDCGTVLVPILVMGHSIFFIPNCPPPPSSISALLGGPGGGGNLWHKACTGGRFFQRIQQNFEPPNAH